MIKRGKIIFFLQTRLTYKSCDIMQHLDLRQEEQISLKSSSNTHKKLKTESKQQSSEIQGGKLSKIRYHEQQENMIRHKYSGCDVLITMNTNYCTHHCVLQLH